MSGEQNLKCKTRPIRAAKAKGIGKLSEVMKIQNEKETKMGLEDKRKRESKRVKVEMIAMRIKMMILWNYLNYKT